MDKESINSFFHIFDYMEDLWLHVFNKVDKNELDFVRLECIYFEYIALKLIEDQKLVECWAGQCSVINIRSED